MANLGPMTAKYSRPASCASFQDVYYTQYTTSDAMYYFQGPVLSRSDCFPLNYQPSTVAFYSPAAVCPLGYTSACDRLNVAGTVTETVHTCCPSIKGTAYKCQTTAGNNYPWQATLACVSVFPSLKSASTTPILFTEYISISNGVTSTKTNLQNPGHGDIGAYGIQLRFQASDLSTITSDPQITSPTTGTGGQPTETHNPPSTGSSGLSAGAAAGIGIGVALGVILVALAAFLIWRRKRKAAAAASKNTESQHSMLDASGASELGVGGSGPYSDNKPPASYLGGADVGVSAGGYYKPDNDRPLSELPAPNHLHEMPDNRPASSFLVSSTGGSPGTTQAVMGTPVPHSASVYGPPSVSVAASSSSPQEMSTGSPQYLHPPGQQSPPPAAPTTPQGPGPLDQQQQQQQWGRMSSEVPASLVPGQQQQQQQPRR